VVGEVRYESESLLRVRCCWGREPRTRKSWVRAFNVRYSRCELGPIALGGLTPQCQLAAMSATQGSWGRQGPRFDGHQCIKAVLQRPAVGEWHPVPTRPHQRCPVTPYTYCAIPRHCPAPPLVAQHSLDLAAALAASWRYGARSARMWPR